MKKLCNLGLLIVLLLCAGLQASAYKFTLEWNDPDAIKIRIGGLTSPDETLEPGQTSYVFEETASKYFYAIVNEGYRIISIETPSGAVNPGFNSSYGQYFSKFCTETVIGQWGEDAKVVITTAKIDRTSNTLTINVENGADYIAPQFSDYMYKFEVANGSNTVGFDPEIDKNLALYTANGVSDFFSVTHNGDTITKRYTWSQYYEISGFKAGDVINIRVFEDDEPSVSDVTLTIDFADGLEDCINNIRNWTTSTFIFPTDITDGTLTVTSGTDLQFNFKDGYNFTSFKLGGTDITDSFASNHIRFKVEEDCTFSIGGAPITYAEVPFTAYITNPEGVILYQGQFGSNEADLTEGSALSAPVTLGKITGSDGSVTEAVTMTAADTKVFDLSVSEKNPYIYIAPQDGWYIYTVQASESGVFTEIDNANSIDGTTTFYVVAHKIDNSASVKFDVTGDSALRLSQNSNKAQRWSNPTTSFSLKEGENIISFDPEYHLPFTLRSLESIDNFQVWLDGFGLTPDDNGAFAIAPYAGSDRQSVVNVFADGKTVGKVASVQIECLDGLTADASVGALRTTIATDNSAVKMLAGSELSIKPSTAASYITLKTSTGTETLHGYAEDGTYVNGLNADGECVFTVTSTRNIITIGAGEGAPVPTVGLLLDPASGSAMKTLSSVKVTIPVDNDEQMFYSDAEAVMGVTLVKDNVTIHGEYLGEPSMNDDGTAYVFPIYFAEPATEAGEYTLTIPQGTFYEVAWDSSVFEFVKLDGGVQSSETTATYTIDPSLTSKIDVYSFLPASGSSLRSLNVVYMEFPGYDAYTMVQINEDLGASFSNGKETYNCMIGYDWNNYSARGFMVIPCDDDYNELTLEAEGEWTLYLPAGTFSYDGESSKAIEATFNIGPDFPIYPITPAPSSVCSSLSEFTITFLGAWSVEYSGTAISLEGPDFSTSTTFVDATSETAFNINFAQTPYTAGEYTLTIPAGTFTVNGEENEEIKATYTFEPGWKLTPAPGMTVESLDKITLEFPSASSVDFVGNELSFILTNGSNYAASGYTCEPLAGAAHPTFVLTINEESQQPPLGNLTFMIVEGSFVVDGVENALIRAPYTIDYTVSTDYIVSPSGSQMLYSEWGFYWSFIFDEALVASATKETASKVKVTFDGKELTFDTDYMAMGEANNILMGVINPEYCHEGTLVVELQEGAFSLSGTPSPAITHTWQVVAPRDYAFELTPDPEDTVNDLSTVKVTFPEATSIEVFNEYGASLTQGYEFRSNAQLSVDEEAEAPTAVLEFFPAPTEKGVYTLSIYAGTFTLDGCQSSPAITVTYTYDETSGVNVIGVSTDSTYTVVTIDGKVILKDASAEDVNTLSTGLYIINGRKVIIK